MNVTEKLLKAKVQLILEQPFFATLALRLEYMADPAIKTARTNGKQLKYNPGYIDRLSVDELKGVLAHEVMHTAMLHHTRRNHRDLKRWNEAADYSINLLLISAGFILPEKFLISDEYKDKSAEQIYNALPTAIPEDWHHAGNDSNGNDDDPGNAGGDQGGTGDVEDAPAADIPEAEAEMKQTLAQAAIVAKRQGKLPAYLERIINDVLQPCINWREVLARFLSEITKNDYTWKKPSARYLYSGLYLPSLETEEAGKIILLVDTSVSIDHALINQFAGEVQDIVNTFKTTLQVIYVDTEVQGVQDIDPDEPLQLHPEGGGGTDFRPGFEYIEENDLQPKAVVYLTDGECEDFPITPDYAVLWAQFGDMEFLPPFGETIQVL